MKTSAKTIILFILLFTLACNRNSDIDKNLNGVETWFKFPKIHSQTKGVSLLNTNEQHFPLSYVQIGSSNLKVIEQYFIDSSFVDSLAHPKSWSNQNKIRILVNTARRLSIKYSNREIEEPPTVDKFGNIIKPVPKPKYDRVSIFPVYILSTSDSIQMLETHDYSLIMIQEALDTDGNWKPIEKFQFSACGNSYFGIPLKPKNYILSGAIEYDGNFQTKLRIKLKTNGKLFYSNEFYGKINLDQFKRVEGFGISYLEKGRVY